MTKTQSDAKTWLAADVGPIEVVLGFVEVEVVGVVWTVDVGELVVDGSVDGFNVDVDVVGVVNSVVGSVATVVILGSQRRWAKTIGAG